jgi:Ni2+-binding GTPase involved in maturation of urease and hydrogenase
MDLADAVEFDLAAADSNIQRVRPGMPLLKVSSKTGAGMADWLFSLAAARERFAQINSVATGDARRLPIRPSR